MSDSDTEVVTRFAANPTRHLDVGDARFALLNRLYAQRSHGRFVLRIDNVGRAGAKDEFAVGIRNDLRWLGIDWADEITQSARGDRYREVFDDLKALRLVYPCYETADELAQQRKQRRAAGLAPVYDRAALKLTARERREIEAAGKRPHWRFRLDDDVILWADAVQREISIPASNVSDPVVMQGAGRALYALSSVVDDVDHGVTHVIASDDLVATTAAQIQIYAAMNAPRPVFAHVAPPLSKQGEIMSRRLFPVRDLKARDIEPLTVASLLVTLGTPHGVNARLALEELANRMILLELNGAAAAARAAKALPPSDWDETTWQSWKRMAGVATKLGGVAIDRLLRLALTGVEDGPEMSILLPMIGRARAEARLAGKTV